MTAGISPNRWSYPMPVAPHFDGTQPCAETDPEAFFPDKGGSPTQAKRICRGCEFREDCLEYALTTRIHGFWLQGIWGGTSAQERQRLRHRTPPRERRVA